MVRISGFCCRGPGSGPGWATEILQAVLHGQKQTNKTDHILGHKTSINKFKKIEIISSIFSNHNGIKLEINYRKKNEKSTNI